jgi:hypothetical protein
MFRRLLAPRKLPLRPRWGKSKGFHPLGTYYYRNQPCRVVATVQRRGLGLCAVVVLSPKRVAYRDDDGRLRSRYEGKHVEVPADMVHNRPWRNR